jgi:hypothetical protein
MDPVRKSWTDQRLDDLNWRMTEGFQRIDVELRRVNNRLDGLQRTMLQTNAVIIAALIGLIATQL